ncbi:MAG: aspartate/glutamate racemase family protein [Candidatus Saccharimonas sp.]
MHIGVFDSGRGGEIIGRYLEKLLPEHNFTVINDLDNVPYGEKSDDEVFSLTEKALKRLLASCPIIVIACNTATAAAIPRLREKYPATKFIGVEPMIKPAAAATKNRHITVLATPSTLRSSRYKDLKDRYASGVTIDEPNTRGWPKLIDDDKKQQIDLSEISDAAANGSDTIVLACTHFIDLYDILKSQFPSAEILEPSDAIARQTAKLIDAITAQQP